jgi:hypothetical protein
MAQTPASKDELKKLEAQLEALRAQLKAAEAALKKAQEAAKKLEPKPGGSTKPLPPASGDKKPDVKRDPGKRPAGPRGAWWDRLSPEQKKKIEERIKKWREARAKAWKDGRGSGRHHGPRGAYGWRGRLGHHARVGGYQGHHGHHGHHAHHGGQGKRDSEDRKRETPKGKPGDRQK